MKKLKNEDKLLLFEKIVEILFSFSVVGMFVLFFADTGAWLSLVVLLARLFVLAVISALFCVCLLLFFTRLKTILEILFLDKD